MVALIAAPILCHRGLRPRCYRVVVRLKEVIEASIDQADAMNDQHAGFEAGHLADFLEFLAQRIGLCAAPKTITDRGLRSGEPRQAPGVQGLQTIGEWVGLRLRGLILPAEVGLCAKCDAQVLDGQKMSHLLDGYAAQNFARCWVLRGEGSVEILHHQALLDLRGHLQQDLGFLDSIFCFRDEWDAMTSTARWSPVMRRRLAGRRDGDASSEIARRRDGAVPSSRRHCTRASVRIGKSHNFTNEGHSRRQPKMRLALSNLTASLEGFPE